MPRRRTATARPTRPKRPKRPKGTGTLSERKDGSWSYGVTLNGRRVQRTAKTKEEAESGLITLLWQKEQGELIVTGRQTVEQYLAHAADYAPSGDICLAHARLSQPLRPGCRRLPPE